MTVTFGTVAICIEQFGSVGDDCAVFLLRSAEEAGHVNQGHQRNVERIAETHEARRLAAGIDIQHAGKDSRLIGNHADTPAAHVRKPDYDIARKVAVDLEEITVVNNAAHNSIHIVSLVGVVGHD